MGQHLRALQAPQGEGVDDLIISGDPGTAAPQSGDADGAQGASASEGDALSEGDAQTAVLETGRKLFAGEWVFQRSCHAMDQLPPVGPAEVAFAGRSNVGKSSLLNALTGRKQLARSSNTPGRTRALNLFARADAAEPVLVDMPGYGYAKAPKSEVEAWTRLVFDYLRGRPSLARVYLLIDARHGVKAVDENAMDVLDEAAVSYQIVLTKSDKVPVGTLPGVTAGVAKAIARRPAAHPDIIVTSAAKDEGLATLRAAIAALVTA